jgi:transposase-like protein
MFGNYTGQKAYCPVCNGEIGYRMKGIVSTFLCPECDFWFTWDHTGGLLKPRQHTILKESKACGCEACKARNEKTTKD